LLIDDDWWREPLNFYASIREDISELLDYMIQDLGYLAYAKQLRLMANHAPYTSPGAVQSLDDFLATEDTADGDF
jgi:hypothetical protein